jgi:CRP/FNR family transcriptional regulator
MASFTKEGHCSCCNLKLNIFRYLNEEELNELNKNRFEVQFHKGETIFKQGGPLTHIACITNGMAKVYIEGENGKNIILKVLRAGEMAGGPGFQVDNRHHFSVSALTDAKACFIDAPAFETSIRNNSHFALEFIKHLNTATIFLYNKLQNLTQKQMHGRIADVLLYLSNRVYINANFETTLSRQDLADMSAMTKESSIRILKELKDDKIIDFDGNLFHILNPSQLEAISKTG